MLMASTQPQHSGCCPTHCYRRVHSVVHHPVAWQRKMSCMYLRRLFLSLEEGGEDRVEHLPCIKIIIGCTVRGESVKRAPWFPNKPCIDCLYNTSQVDYNGSCPAVLCVVCSYCVWSCVGVCVFLYMCMFVCASLFACAYLCTCACPCVHVRVLVDV